MSCHAAFRMKSKINFLFVMRALGLASAAFKLTVKKNSVGN